MLERLDGLTTDGLSDEQRTKLRQMRKQMVQRCEALSKEAARRGGTDWD